MKYAFMKLKPETKQIIFACIIYVTLFGFLLAYSLNFDFNKIVEGGDTLAPLDPFLFLKKGLYIWEDSVLGRINVLAFIEILYSLPLALLYLLFPPSIAHFIYWLALYSLMPISFFLLAYYLTRNFLISFYGGLLYSLNLYTAIIHHTPVYHMLYLHGVTPLLVLSFVKYLKQKEAINKYLLLYSIMYLPLLRIFNMYVIYFLLLPMYSYIILRYFKKYRISLKTLLRRLVIVSTVLVIVSLPYIFVLEVSLVQVTYSPVTTEYSMRMVETSSIYAQLLNVIRFIITYGWVRHLPEMPGIQGFSSSRIYSDNILLIVITFYPVLFMMLLTIIALSKKYITKFYLLNLGLIVILLFLMKMINPPLGQVNEFLYKNIPFFLVLFRSAWKYMQIPYILLLSIVIVTVLNFLCRRLSKKSFYAIMLVILVVHSVYISPAILIFSKLINSAWIVEVPKDYFIVANFFNKQKDPFRILPLPLSKHFTGYIPYSWGYAGPDLLYTLLNKPMIDKYHNPVLSNASLNLVNRVEQLSYSNIERLIYFARLLNVKYILVRKSVNLSHPYIKVWCSPKVYMDSLNLRSDVVKVLETENFVVYRLISYCPRIWVVSLENLYNKSIIESHIYAINVTSNTTISLQLNRDFGYIHSLHFFADFKLLRKNVTSNDWRIVNYQLILTDAVKISISPKGILYVFLYYGESNTRKFTPIVINIPKASLYDRNKIEISYVNNSLSIIFNGLVLYNETISINLWPKITHILVGGAPRAEKMVGEIYNMTLIVNNETVLSFNDLIETLPDKTILIKNELTKSSPLTSTCSPKSIGVIKFVKMINPTLWKARIKLYKPAIIVFSETYDPHWRLIIYKDGTRVTEIRPFPILNGLNGFIIHETGDILIEIRYTPQESYFISIIISITLLAMLCIILTFKSKVKTKFSLAKVNKL